MKSIFLIFTTLLLCITELRAETIRIGILTDLSGGMASWGNQTRVGAQIAEREIKSDGGDVKLLFGDHQLQAKTAVSEFQKLVEINNVRAIYSEFTPTTAAIAPLAKTKRTPLIYSAAASSLVQNAPYIFKSYLNYVQGCRAIAAYWKTQGISTVGILKANLEFGELCAQGLMEVFPEAVEVSYNPGDDVSTQVLTLKSKRVGAIMNATFEPDLLRMLKSIRNLGWKPLIGTQDDAVASETRDSYSDLLDRITVFSLPTLSKDFMARVKSDDPKNNFVSISAAGLAYLHVKQLYFAALQCGKEDADCMKVHLADSKSDTTTGFMGWKNQIAIFDLALRSWSKGQAVEQITGPDRDPER